MRARGPRTVRAAGAVVWRRHDGTDEVLVVHRPRYDDWSLPKGKLASREPAPLAATREVHEETGVRVRLGPELRPLRYRLPDGTPKEVRFWSADPVATETFAPDDEVDEVAWLDLAEARRRLRPAELALARGVLRDARTSHPLVVVRHALALRRKDWPHHDADRPLTRGGHRQSAELAELLTAWAPTRIITSPSRRCHDTVAPLAERTGLALELEPALSEESYEESPKAARALLRRLHESDEPVVVCTHRPLLADTAKVIGLELPKSARSNPLPKAAIWVSHGEPTSRVERYGH